MSLYLAVEICTLAIPLSLSFDRKVAFYRKWYYLFPSIVINAMIFIVIDIYFTSKGTWGFNPEYHSGIIIAGLPIEEILFFIIIPYSSLFIHYVFISYYPNISPGIKFTRVLSAVLISGLIITAIIFSRRAYTSFYALLTAALITLAVILNIRLLSRYYLTFLIIMIPFIIVNGILTGSFSGSEVFWYNTSEISEIRIFSIPVEDVLFGFNLILLNLLTAGFMDKLLRR